MVVVKQLDVRNSDNYADLITSATNRKADLVFQIALLYAGVTDGALLKGVRLFGAGKRTHSLIMTTDARHIRFIDSVHVEGGPDTVIRF